MSMLEDTLARQHEALETYLATTSSVGIVLLDPALHVLDCNLGFTNLFNLRKKPAGAAIATFLKLGPDDLKQSGSFKVSCNTNSGVNAILRCTATATESGLLLFCERFVMTESRAMEQIGIINNDLITLQRESVKKNLLLENMRKELDQRIAELEATLARVKQLEGIIPICMYCKKIRDDQQSWHQLEKYITDHSEALFSHGVCPHCAEEQIALLRNMKPL